MGKLSLFYRPSGFSAYEFPSLYLFLTILAINLLIHKINMDPCRVFDSWGGSHGKISVCKLKYATLQEANPILKS
jgi:hypothetical protein